MIDDKIIESLKQKIARLERELKELKAEILRHANEECGCNVPDDHITVLKEYMEESTNE